MIDMHIFIQCLNSFYQTTYTLDLCVDAAPHVIRTCRYLVMALADDIIRE